MGRLHETFGSSVCMAAEWNGWLKSTRGKVWYLCSVYCKTFYSCHNAQRNGKTTKKDRGKAIFHGTEVYTRIGGQNLRPWGRIRVRQCIDAYLPVSECILSCSRYRREETCRMFTAHGQKVLSDLYNSCLEGNTFFYVGRSPYRIAGIAFDYKESFHLCLCQEISRWLDERPWITTFANGIFHWRLSFFRDCSTDPKSPEVAEASGSSLGSAPFLRFPACHIGGQLFRRYTL